MARSGAGARLPGVRGGGVMATRGLYREFRLRGPEAWHALMIFIKANARACVDRGQPLRVIVTEEEKIRSSEANARYWALLTEIAEAAWVNGRQFDKEVWHEHFARLFLPLDEVILPTGEIVQRRQTTTKLTVAAFSEYMQKIEAEAASELGVVFEEAFV